MTKKYVVYTALFGDYDNIIEPDLVKDDAVDYILFTDQRNLKSTFWEIRLVDSSDFTSVVMNRMYKMLPHIFLPDYEISLYIDANVVMKKTPLPSFEHYLEDVDIAFPRHYERDCVYQELKVCLLKSKISKSEYDLIRRLLLSKGYPLKVGLGGNMILLRRHRVQHIVNLMEEWFESFRSGVKRDQLYLFPLIWEKQIKYRYLRVGVRAPNPYFYYRPHKRSKENKGFLGVAVINLTSRQADNYFFFILSRVIAFFGSLKRKLL